MFVGVCFVYVCVFFCVVSFFVFVCVCGVLFVCAYVFGSESV